MEHDMINPYVGLRPYTIEESLLFFGRDAQTKELLQRLHEEHFVAVVGSSGCGKSSLILAGLIPALKAGHLIEGSDVWLVFIMKPGQNPLYNMVEAIMQQLEPGSLIISIEKLVGKIKTDGIDPILEIIEPLRKEKNVSFFLLIDQFEELFRFSMEQSNEDKKDEAVIFVNLIIALSQQSEVPFYIVFSMRSDFIGDCSQFHGLPEVMNKSQYLVPRLSRSQLKKVIEGPAKLFNGKINSALSSKLLNHLGHYQDELPVLQHALMRMWDHETKTDKNNELDLDDYNNIGGVEKALSNHADEALADMTESQRKIAEKVFKALTSIDGSGRKIRRPALLSNLIKLSGANHAQLKKIIDYFTRDDRSFLVEHKASNTDDIILDISHESLIRQWGTLNRWVDEEDEAATNYLHLTEAYSLHTNGKKDLLVGREFEIKNDWYKNFKPSKAWSSQYNDDFDGCMSYLAESRKVYDRKKYVQRRKRAIKRRIKYATIALVGAIAIIYSMYSFFGGQKTEEDIIWSLATENNSVESYLDYINFLKNEELTDHSDHAQHVQDAKDAIDIIVFDSIWKATESLNKLDAYQNYVDFVQSSKFSSYAKHKKLAEERIAAIQNTGLLDIDNVAWNEAVKKNTVTAYLNYYTNDDLIGSHNTEAIVKIKEIGSIGFLFCGRKDGAKISDSERVFDLVKRNEVGFEADDIVRPGDIVVLRERLNPRNIYSNRAHSVKSNAVVNSSSKYYVNAVHPLGNAITVEIIY